MHYYTERGNELKAIQWPVSLHAFFSGKRKHVADGAKTLPITIKRPR
jgi:hypothetical protein